MGFADHPVTPETIAAGDGRWRPFGLIELDAWPADATIPCLPPYPLVGRGDPAHPLAGRLDALIEPPVSADALARGIARAPHAAAALVHLLRGIGALDPEAAILQESLCQAMLQGSAEHGAWLAAAAERVPSEAGSIRVAREGAVLHVALDRPWARNAIDRAMRDGLREAFTVAALDPEIGTVRLRAGGAAFSVGADLAEFGTTRDPATAHLIRARTLPALPLLRRPGILDVHARGPCIGAGLEIAAWAGRFTASPDAWFQLPELAMGIIPGAGGCVSVPRRIGRRRAALMILSGRRINAATALAWGLIDAIVDAPAADEDGADMG